MMQNSSDPDEKQEKFITYFPVIIFIILIFILEVFHLQKATSLVVSVLISFFIYGISAAGLKQKYGNLPAFKPLNLYLGLLTFMFLAIVGVAILHWFLLVHVNLRWILFFAVLLIYFIILFRAVHTLYDLKVAHKGKELKTIKKLK